MSPPRDLDKCYTPAAGSRGCDHRLYSHAVQFYFDDQVLVRFTSEFVISALRAGDGAVILATDLHRRAIAQALRDRGIEVAKYIRKGRYRAMSAEDAMEECMSSGAADFSRFRRRFRHVLREVNVAATNDNPRAMVFGELVSLFWQKRNRKAVLALEKICEELAQENSFTLFCGYSIKEFSEAGSEKVLLKICDAHATMIPPDQYPNAESERRILNATLRHLHAHPPPSLKGRHA
jgi:hypothetical protein